MFVLQTIVQALADLGAYLVFVVLPRALDALQVLLGYDYGTPSWPR